MRSREIYDLEGSGRHIEKPLVQQEVGMVMEVFSAFMETRCWKSACEFQSIEGWTDLEGLRARTRTSEQA